MRADAATPVVVAGMAVRLAGVETIPDLWRLLCSGQSRIGASSKGVEAAIDDPLHFDAALFDIPEGEAALLEPQHRLFMETAFRAIESAGVTVEDIAAQTGVFAAMSPTTRRVTAKDEARYLVDAASFYRDMLGSEDHFLASRVAYYFNFCGPALTVHCACSSSLAAVWQACAAIRSGDCGFAIAGGVALRLPQHQLSATPSAGILSPSGRMRPFDAACDGIIPGYGAAVTLLASEDMATQFGLPIRARILGGAMNNDGRRKAGYTAPSVTGQSAALGRALERAGCSPAAVRYIEAHGTGTNLGDPIEVEAIRRAYPPQGREPISLGSVKAVFGHLDAAAGALGLIKSVLVAENRSAPPQAGFDAPNPHLRLENAGLAIATAPTPLGDADAPLAVATSSFGMGGTNVHLVLQAPAEIVDPAGDVSLRLSANSAAAAERLARDLADFVESAPRVASRLGGLARTLAQGRKRDVWRSAVLLRAGAKGAAIAVALRRAQPALAAKAPRALFVFSGQAAGMPLWMRDVIREAPRTREMLEARAAALRAETWGAIADFLFGDTVSELPGDILQPAHILFQLVAADLLSESGVRPVAALGHSLGEFSAAVVSGQLDVEIGLRLAEARGRLTDRMREGRMFAALASETAARDALRGFDGVEVAAVNSPACVVLSGEAEAANEAARLCAAAGLPLRFLDTDRGFHSGLLDPLLGEWRTHLDLLDGNRPSASAIAFYSTATGEKIEPSKSNDRGRWVDQFRRRVRFAETLSRALVEQSPTTVVEIGPQILLSHIKAVAKDFTPGLVAAACAFPAKGEQGLSVAEALEKLWCSGFDTPPRLLDARRLADVPGRPLQRKFHAYVRGPTLEAVAAPPPAQAADAEPQSVEAKLRAIWAEALGVNDIADDANFFDLGGDSLLALSVCRQIETACGLTARLETLMLESTFASFAKGVADGGGERPRSHLFPPSKSIFVPLRLEANQAAPPVFALHPAGGTVFPFIPVFAGGGRGYAASAIQFPHWREDIWADSSIARLADLYAEEILKGTRASQTRKLRLLGYSFGGNVAHAVAARLIANGVDVDRILMLDTHPPEAYPNVPEAATDYDAVMEFILGALRLPPPLLASAAAALRSGGQDAGTAAALANHGLTIDDVRLFYRIWRANHKALKEHVVDPPIASDIVYVKAKDAQDARIVEGLQLDMQAIEMPKLWERYINGRLHVVEVHGSHYTMMSPPFVEDVARVVHQALNGGLPQ
jgi:phthiocerol/phenolphthiocerol synthesis type-I polyketide synthase E